MAFDCLRGDSRIMHHDGIMEEKTRWNSRTRRCGYLSRRVLTKADESAPSFRSIIDHNHTSTSTIQSKPKMIMRTHIWVIMLALEWMSVLVLAAPLARGARGSYPKCIRATRKTGMAHYRGWKIVGNDVSQVKSSPV